MEKETPYPVRTEYFHQVPVLVFRIDGQDHIPSVTLGNCLGFEDPRRSMENLYARHKKELRPHTRAITSIAPGESTPVKRRLFNPVGANLVCMHARTEKAEAVRLWLATLPGRVREFRQAIQERLDLDSHTPERYPPKSCQEPKSRRFTIAQYASLQEERANLLAFKCSVLEKRLQRISKARVARTTASGTALVKSMEAAHD